jgi:hypothetical protein
MFLFFPLFLWLDSEADKGGIVGISLFNKALALVCGDNLGWSRDSGCLPLLRPRGANKEEVHAGVAVKDFVKLRGRSLLSWRSPHGGLGLPP